MKLYDYRGIVWSTKLLLLVSLFTLATSSNSYAQDPYQRLVRKIETPDLGLANPAGLIYSPGANAMFVTSSSGSATLQLVTFDPELRDAVTLATTLADPINMAFDGMSNSLILWDAGANELVQIEAGADGRPLSSSGAISRFDASTFGINQAKGISIDPETGDLFILVAPAKPAVPGILRIIPDSQSRFADPIVSTVIPGSLQGEELRGIAFNPNNGHLYVIAPAAQALYELTLDGEVVSTRDLSSFELRGPQQMVFAPSSDQTDDPEIMNLFIADSGQNNGDNWRGDRIFTAAEGPGNVVELSLTEPELLVAPVTIQANLVRTVQTSNWNPPSPDPAGIAYYPPANGLMISDSEVNEMSIFKGVNYWQVTLSGAQVDEYTTTSDFSDEPTGVAYNPNNGHLFFTDDTGTRTVYELNPGNDGKYNTSDDIVTHFKTGDFGSADPEGIAYDQYENRLFVVDGANAEIYEVRPGSNGLFDGVDDVVKHFDTSKFGLSDPEGVEFNYESRNLYIAGRGVNYIVETTTEGTELSRIDVSSANPKKLAGIAYGPSSGNASQRSLYLVDRGSDNDSNPNENDGKLYEISLGASTATPSLAIDNVTVQERDAGTVDAVFTVTMTGSSQQTVTVNYATGNGGTATSGVDYVAKSGSLSFSSGVTSRNITVQVNGDQVEEGDETFFVNLSNVSSNATIADGQGIGTITDDDGTGPMVASFQDGVNGYSGTRDAVLKADTPTTNYGSGVENELDGSPDEVTLLRWDITGVPVGSIVESVQITYNVTNSSGATYEIYELKRAWSENEATWNAAESGQNWQAAGATGSQDRGVTPLGSIVGPSTGSTTISLDAAGIAVVQGWVNDPSSNHGLVAQDFVSSNGLDFSSREASVVTQRPKLTIAYVGSGEPVLSIDDVTVTEGNSGTVNADFTVTLFPASDQPVTVKVATADGTATAGSDYVAISNTTLTFAAGETSKTVPVVVNGDQTEEGDETFTVNLSDASSNASIGIAQGTGTITGDDGTGPLVATFQDGLDGYTGTRDAVIKADTPTTNYGVETKLELDGKPDEATLIYWDVTNIPTGSTVESVQITYNVTNTSGGSYEVYDLKRAWAENEVTWNEAASGQGWQVAGADGSQDRGLTPLGSLVGSSTGIKSISLNAAGVAVVQAWVNDASSNHGVIVLDYAVSNGLDFSSREVPPITNRPMLTVAYHSSSQVSNILTSTSDTPENLPQTLTMSPNYPNPFNLETRIDYTLPESGQVRMVIYNIVGQKVRTLVDEMQPAGTISVVWDGRDDAGQPVGSGVYFNRLQVNHQSLVRKLVLQK